MDPWPVEYADEFLEEVEGYPRKVQDKIAALALVLQKMGPHIGKTEESTR